MVHMRRSFIFFAVLAFAGGCGGGGSGPSAPFAAPPAPTASPAPPPAGPLSASQSALAFTAQGQSATIVVGEPGYAGNIGFDAAPCAAIATVTPANPQPAPATYAVTAQGAGSCTLAFIDGFGQRAPVTVGVTLTQGSLK
jgi:hypothetical protein